MFAVRVVALFVFLDLLVSAVRAYIYVGGDAHIAPLWFMVVKTG